MDMNNVVQNIEVSMIIPPSERLMIDDNLQNLVDSIREYGILEPLLLRPNNGKYQIIIGNKRYEAARLLGLKTVPALVKNVDDEVVEQYKMINNYDKKKMRLPWKENLLIPLYLKRIFQVMGINLSLIIKITIINLMNLNL